MLAIFFATLFTQSCAQFLLLSSDAPPLLTTEADAKIPPRHECAAWCVKDDVYVYGGSADQSHALNDFWKYETENGRWLWMPDPPATLPPMKNTAYWSIREEMYVFGNDLLWKYEPDTRKWSEIQPTSDTPPMRENAAFWTHKPSNQLFLLGGYSESGNGTLTDMWSYNVQSNTWKQIQYAGVDIFQFLPISNARFSAVLGNSEDTVYYLRGKMYQLDLTTMTWSISPIGGQIQPDQRESYTMFLSRAQDKVCIFGGRIGSKLFGDYWLYDPRVERWTPSEASGLPSDRWGSCGCTDNSGDYYMFGGTFEDPKHFHNDLWKYGPINQNNLWQILNFKFDAVALSSYWAAVMSTIMVTIVFFASLCICVKKCKRKKHELNEYKVGSAPLTNHL